MMEFLKTSFGGRYQPDSRWSLLEREQPTGFSYPAACPSVRTNAPPATNVLRAQRNCPSHRSVECLEPLPKDRSVLVPDHFVAPQKSFPSRAAFGRVLAARCGPLFHSAGSEENQAA